MFSKNYSFKYSDLDNTGNIKLITIMDLLQDVSIFHSASVGYTLPKMKEISIAMLLRGWRVKFKEPVSFDIPAEVKTGIVKTQRCDVIRKYEIWQNDKCKAVGSAHWFSFDFSKERIVRIPDEIIDAYDCINEDDNNLPILNLRPNSDAKLCGETTITKKYLDTNNHVNNVKSIEIALDYLPDNFNVSEMSVIYQKELHLGDKVLVHTQSTSEGLAVELRNQKDEPCVLLLIS